MPNSVSPEHGWMPWSSDTAVEYQIADEFLRIRHWQDGQLKISAWQKWERSTDETIRQLQRVIAWSELPKHRKVAPQREKPVTLREHIRAWLRDHLLPS